MIADTAKLILSQLFALALALFLVACSSETRVRISGAPPGQEDQGSHDPPFAAEFCLPSAYSDGNFSWARDGGAVAINFLHPSLSPGGRDRTADGFVRMAIWPGPDDGRRFDYSQPTFPTHGAPLPHPHMAPAALAVQQSAISREPVPPAVFPSFTSDTYAILFVADEFRRRVDVRCTRDATQQMEWCTARFQTALGFVADVSARADTMYDMIGLMNSVDILTERFLAACDEAR
jgi:hypothetical protein